MVKRTCRIVASAFFVFLTLFVLPVSANAAFSSPFEQKCSGKPIVASGAPIQALLYDSLDKLWRSHHTTRGSTGGCGPTPQTLGVWYRSVVDPNGVTLGTVPFGSGTNSSLLTLDRPPTPSERLDYEAAEADSATELAIAPSGQYASTLIANFPSGCELPAGDPDLAPYARFRLPAARLLEAITGAPTADTWGELLPGIKGMPGSGRSSASCKAQAVVRVTAAPAQPELLLLIQYLFHVAGQDEPSQYDLPNGWPNSGITNIVSGLRQIEVPLKVQSTSGSIAVTDLASARAGGFAKHSASSIPAGAYRYDGNSQQSAYPVFGRSYSFADTTFWVPLEILTEAQPTGSGRYAEPTVDRLSIRTGRRGANCRYTEYRDVPTSGGLPDWRGDWTAAIATGDPGRYPLCQLAWSAWWLDPSDVRGLSDTAQGRARSARDLMTFVMNQGQNWLFKYDYAPVPRPLRYAGRAAARETGWRLP